VLAETRYVSDNLEIDMRTGKGYKYSIIRMLRGTPVSTEVDKEEATPRCVPAMARKAGCSVAF
jgi:hypothetical protein